MSENQDRDIFDQLTEANRRFVSGRKLPDGELTWAMIEAIQGDLRRSIDTGVMSMKQIARSLGAGYSTHTLRAFINATATQTNEVDLQRVARGINQLNETTARRQGVARPDGWVETQVARRMLTVIAKTIELSSIGLIYSDAGRGKSITLKAAQSIFPGSILIRLRTGSTSASGVARLLYSEIGLRGNVKLHDMLNRIIDKLHDSNRAIMIDEAHRLEPAALETIRDIHDESEVPVVLSGTQRINDLCSDQDLWFGQMASRIAIRYDVTEETRNGGTPPGSGGASGRRLHTVEEIRRLYASDKVRFTGDGLTFLTDLANLLGMGGLRLCTKVVMVGAEVANGHAIDAKLLRGVLRQLHGREHVGQCIERMMERNHGTTMTG